MTENYEFNELITTTLYERCPDENVKKLLKRILQYELDTYNRNPRKTDVMAEYKQMVDKTYREMN